MVDIQYYIGFKYTTQRFNSYTPLLILIPTSAVSVNIERCSRITDIFSMLNFIPMTNFYYDGGLVGIKRHTITLASFTNKNEEEEKMMERI